MRPELVRRIVAGYAIALTALALVLLPGRGSTSVAGDPAAVAPMHPPAVSNKPPAPTPVPSTPTAVPVVPTSSSSASPAPRPTRTHRTARTPAPGPSGSPAAQPTPTATRIEPSTERPNSADPEPPASESPIPSPTPEPIPTPIPAPSQRDDRPPGDFRITSGNDLSSCNGGRTFTVIWSPSQGATRYTVQTSNQGSRTVGGTSVTLSCPTRTGTFTITVIAYNERMQGTNAPTVTYHEPDPLDDPTPGPGSTSYGFRAPIPSPTPTPTPR